MHVMKEWKGNTNLILKSIVQDIINVEINMYVT